MAGNWTPKGFSRGLIGSAGKEAISRGKMKFHGKVTGITSDSIEVDEQTFTSSGTWTKPAGAIMTYIYCVGGGGGGGSGGRGTHHSGAGGGAGGGTDLQMFISAALGSTMSVAVGAAGSGAAAKTSSNSIGGDGTAGGNSTVTNGSDIIAHGNGSNGGLGGGHSVGGAGSPIHRGMLGIPLAVANYSGHLLDTTPGSGGCGEDDDQGRSGVPGFGPGGGGGGTNLYDATYRAGQGGRGSAWFNGIGSVMAAPTIGNTMEGGTIRAAGWTGTYEGAYTIWTGNQFFWDEDSTYKYVMGVGGGGNGASSDGGTGSNGTARTFGGDGGGGGGGVSSGNAGAGGDGGFPGGGGGGGGSQTGNDGNTGAGGDGAAGKVWIWTVRFAQ